MLDFESLKEALKEEYIRLGGKDWKNDEEQSIEILARFYQGIKVFRRITMQVTFQPNEEGVMTAYILFVYDQSDLSLPILLFDAFIKMLTEQGIGIEIEETEDYSVYTFDAPILFAGEIIIQDSSIGNFLYNIYITNGAARETKIAPLDLDLLCSDDKMLSVHKIVLAALDIPLFQTILIERKESRILLKEYDVKTVSIFVDYAYLGSTAFIQKYKNTKLDLDQCFDLANFYRLQSFFNTLMRHSIGNVIYDQTKLILLLEQYDDTQIDNPSFVEIVAARDDSDFRDKFFSKAAYKRLTELLKDKYKSLADKFIFLGLDRDFSDVEANGVKYIFKFNDIRTIEFEDDEEQSVEVPVTAWFAIYERNTHIEYDYDYEIDEALSQIDFEYDFDFFKLYADYNNELYDVAQEIEDSKARKTNVHDFYLAKKATWSRKDKRASR